MSKEERKLLEGRLFCPGDPELRAMKLKSHKLSRIYSDTHEENVEEREKLLKDMLCEFGEGSYMTGPVFFHYGVHTKIGKCCFFNYNLTVQDDSWVTIGDRCVIGAGSVVTRDIPSDSFAAGNPCKVIRKITEDDRI